MKPQHLFMIFIMVVITGCDACKLAKGDLRDSQNESILKKRFMKSCMFNGVVLKRIYCDECDDRSRYQIVIALESIKPEKVEFRYISYPPHYSIDLVNKSLTISVTEDLYNVMNVGSKVRKPENSEFITIAGNDYRLISEKQYKWLPN